MLVVALTARPQTLLVATEDALHQEYRRPAMPESMALVDALRAEGVAAVVSGAGPSVLVLGEPDALEAAARAHAAGLGVVHASRRWSRGQGRGPGLKHRPARPGSGRG